MKNGIKGLKCLAQKSLKRRRYEKTCGSQYRSNYVIELFWDQIVVIVICVVHILLHNSNLTSNNISSHKNLELRDILGINT